MEQNQPVTLGYDKGYLKKNNNKTLGHCPKVF